MMTRNSHSQNGSGAFASATLRALSSAVLLLGLIGDRRAP
jgi:hypothetical protein